MKKSIKSILCLITIVTMVFSPCNLFAAPKENRINIIEEYYGKGQPNTIVEFTDENLVNSTGETSSDITTRGVISEQYDHSTYTLGNQQISEYSCGPLNDQKFIISVPKGQTLTSTTSTTVSGTVSYSASVNATIRNLINVEFTSNVSGTIQREWESGKSYVGPAESSPYNSRQYYAAIDYDLYNIEVSRCDVYKVYNDTAFVRYEYYYSTEYVDNVKRPKAIQYSKDFAY